MNELTATKGIWLDPRTKILLLILCVISAMLSPSLEYELALVLLIAVLGCLCGRPRYALIAVIAYALIYALTLFILDSTSGTLQTMFIAFLGLVHKVYPCGMIAGIAISTTKVSEFLSSMDRIRAPKKVVIPLAVMLRYMPTIREDWRYIRMGCACVMYRRP